MSRHKSLIRGAIDKYRGEIWIVHMRKGRDVNGEQQTSLSRAANKGRGYAIVFYQLNPKDQARAIRGH